MASPWKPGDQIVLREVWQGKVWTGRPVTVVQDEPDLLALFIPAGTPWRKPVAPDGGPLRLPVSEWVLADQRQPIDVLRLTTPGARHGVLVFWREGHREFIGWYINLEEPLRRTAIGFDYMDQALDVVISADRTQWEWKDEDELMDAQAAGILTAQDAREVRAEGERAIRLLESGQPPFNGGWERWSPDPAWRIPELPEGWERHPC